jgi:hypothetical protein
MVMKKKYKIILYYPRNKINTSKKKLYIKQKIIKI